MLPRALPMATKYEPPLKISRMTTRFEPPQQRPQMSPARYRPTTPRLEEKPQQIGVYKSTSRFYSNILCIKDTLFTRNPCLLLYYT